MPRPAYPYDLTDAEWAHPRAAGAGAAARVAVRPRHPRREIVNAILYVLRTGCQWRALPHDLPPWGTVWWYFRRWREDGVWERSTPRLREQARVRLGPRADPERGDPGQPVGQDHGKGGPRGYDAGKKINGRKRHLLVDTEGLLLKVRGPSGRRDRRRGGQAAARRAGAGLPAPGADLGRRRLQAPLRRVGGRTTLGWRVEVVQHPEAGRARASGWRRGRSRPRSRPGSGCCRGAGWWSAPSPGWAATGG